MKLWRTTAAATASLTLGAALSVAAPGAALAQESIPSPPPDLDCSDVEQDNFEVSPGDPHRFDADNDGIGCEDDESDDASDNGGGNEAGEDASDESDDGTDTGADTGADSGSDTGADDGTGDMPAGGVDTGGGAASEFDRAAALAAAAVALLAGLGVALIRWRTGRAPAGRR
ncbi:hypothetical protein [Streptomonospora salina]|uniref:hypothetical protein n=1 Tax=Streptomonospora salina TaxID=104205 RepID=UPI0035EA2F3B